VPDPFATSGDAAGFGYALPGATADGLLARATQMLVDAAGFGIVSGSATVRLRAECGVVSLQDVPLVTAVSAVALVSADGTTTTAVDGADWTARAVSGIVPEVCLGHAVTCRWDGLFDLTLTQGLAAVPDSLTLLTSAIAYRLAAMPAAMSAGITSRSVGGVSWSAPKPPPDSDLTSGELCKLAGIVPVRTVWPVPL
jgi:hypothetical protein